MRHIFRSLRNGLIVLAALCQMPNASVEASSPQQTGSFSGTITDPSGAAIPGASISLKNEHQTDKTTTDGAGHFQIQLAFGDYILIVESPGFRTYSKPIRLNAGSLYADVMMTLGGGSTVQIDKMHAPPPLEILNAKLTAVLPLSPLPRYRLFPHKLNRLSK